MTLPFVAVALAARRAGDRAGVFPVGSLAKALVETPPCDDRAAALHLARLAAGPSADTLTARELELELAALTEDARSLVRVVAPALAAHEAGAAAHRALLGIGAAMGAVFAAMVPPAVVVDATLIQACRECAWGAPQLAEKGRGKELVRRLARSLGLPVNDGKGVEDEATSASKLTALDPERAAEGARRRELEKAIRARLPKV